MFQTVKSLSAMWRPGFNPWVGKILWRRKWQSTPVFLPGKFHGQRSLADYSPWVLKELDMTERLTNTHMLLSIAEQNFQCCLDKTSALPPSLLDSVTLSVALAACRKPYASPVFGHLVWHLLSLKYLFCFSSSKAWSEVTQSCPTLCDPVDCSPPGSSVHGILQARILEWVAISFSRGSSQPRDQTQVSRIAGRCFNLWATSEAPKAQWSPPISTPCFMNFHTTACLPDKLDLFLLKKCVFPLPSSSWQSSPSSHQATVISVFLGCHCKFAERKECAVPGDYLCWVGCNHRVRKDCYRHRSKETWQ